MEVVLVAIPKDHSIFSNFDYFLLDIFIIIAAELNQKSFVFWGGYFFFNVAMYIYWDFLRREFQDNFPIFCITITSTL